MLDERLKEQAALYALDVLDPGERRTFETRLASDVELQAEVRELRHAAVGLAYAVPQIDPPASLRARVLGAVTSVAPPQSSHGRREETSSDSTPGVVPFAPIPTGGARTWPAWLAAAAALVIAAGLGSYTMRLRSQVDDLQTALTDSNARVSSAEARVTSAESSVARLQQTVVQAEARSAVLTAPDTASIVLLGQKVSPAARARAYWSRSRGLVFAASQLPALPQGKVYQLWVLAGTTPISAGLLTPDTQGQAVVYFETPADLPRLTAMAVTLEPEGGLPQPSGAMYLLGAIGN
ncbi:MAG: anti-sigma factor [Vicinamibacterales bacterium]